MGGGWGRYDGAGWVKRVGVGWWMRRAVWWLDFHSLRDAGSDQPDSFRTQTQRELIHIKSITDNRLSETPLGIVPPF